MAGTSHDPNFFHPLPGDPATKINRVPDIDPKGRYLKKINDVSGSIYAWQQALSEEPTMVECDHLGRPVEAKAPAMPYIPGSEGAQVNSILAQMTNTMNKMHQQMSQMRQEQEELKGKLALAQSQISGHDPNVRAPVAVSHVDGAAVDMPDVGREAQDTVSAGGAVDTGEYFLPPDEDETVPQVTTLPDGTVQVGATVPDMDKLRPVDEGGEIKKDIEAMKKEFRKAAYGEFTRQVEHRNALRRFVETWMGKDAGVDFRGNPTKIVQEIISKNPRLGSPQSE